MSKVYTDAQRQAQQAQPHEVRLVDLVGCPECGRNYLQKNIYRHLWNQHNWSREECKQLINMIKSEKKLVNGANSFGCDICGVAFKNFLALVVHQRICMNRQEKGPIYHETSEKLEGEDEEVIDPVYVEEEEILDMQPSTSTAREEEEEEEVNVHDDEPQEKTTKVDSNEESNSQDQKPRDFPLVTVASTRFRQSTIACPLCKKPVESSDELVGHCHLEHETEDTKYLLEQRIFPDVQSFKEWFDQRQEDTCTSLTKRTGHGGETFYRCHMVGKYMSVAKKRKSKPRKLDQCCTAFLKVYLHPDGSTYASGCFSHIGHELNHKLLWFTESQENYVRELLDLGWNSDQIYFYIREEYEGYECKLKYISKNDIRNISVRHERAKQKKIEDPDSSPKMFEDEIQDDDTHEDDEDDQEQEDSPSTSSK